MADDSIPLPAPQDRADPTPQLRNLMYEMREAVKRCCAPGVPEARWGYVSDFNVLEWATRLEKLLGEVAAPARAAEWRCFHCDEVFTDKTEAREHFGEYLDDSPACLIKGEDGGLLKRVRELEAEVLNAYNQRNAYENDARLWHESEADRVRRIGHVQWWQELDSREGEKLALLERVADLEKQIAARAAEWQPLTDRPKIICLCGSTKFIEQFAIKTWELELEGSIVLGCTLLPYWYCGVRDHFAEKIGVKGQRDEHHLRKIDLADEVLVLNIGGYIGESTRNEIAYATAHGKPVNYLEPLPPCALTGRKETK
jgi:hypothetical protein